MRSNSVHKICVGLGCVVNIVSSLQRRLSPFHGPAHFVIALVDAGQRGLRINVPRIYFLRLRLLHLLRAEHFFRIIMQKVSRNRILPFLIFLVDCHFQIHVLGVGLPTRHTLIRVRIFINHLELGVGGRLWKSFCLFVDDASDAIKLGLAVEIVVLGK